MRKHRAFRDLRFPRLGGMLGGGGGGGGPPAVFRSVLGSGSPTSNTLNDTGSGTWFGPFGGRNAIVTSAGTKNTVEAYNQRGFRAGIISELCTILAQQTRTAVSAWRTRINGAYGNSIAQNPGGAIGAGSYVVYADATHTDAVADGDLVNTALDYSSDAGFMVCPYVGANFETSTASQTWFAFATAASISYSTSALRYIGLTGSALQLTTSMGAPMPLAGVFSRAQIVVTAGGAVTKLFSTNINGVIGNCSVPMDAIALLEDATHTDAVVQGDLVQGQLSGGGTTTGYVGGAVMFSSTAANCSPVIAHGVGDVGGNGIAPASFWSGFNQLRRNNVEAESRTAIAHACVASRISVNVVANINAGDLSMVSRVSGATMNQAAIIPAGVAAVFTDATHTDAMTLGSNLTHMSDQAQDAGTKFCAISYALQVAS